MSQQPEKADFEKPEPSKELYYEDLIKSIRDRLRAKNLLSDSKPSQKVKETTIEVTFINRKKTSKP